ncbi:MAG: FKBP-type peptidyl-prolyl cis-trans isomerase [Treponema sp.]|nr:FKBP-type peptidyl-prolyl cis-trans isomerase [Treponema sp.]
MKKYFFLLILLNGFLVMSFSEGIRQESIVNNEKADASYAFGMVIASELQQTYIDFDYPSFIRGFREVMEKQQTLMSMDDASQKVDDAVTQAMAAVAKANQDKEAAFLAANGAKPGVYTTSSGLQYEILTEGDGAQPAADDTVEVNYVGYLMDGTVFDSSYDRGEPEQFPLNGVIPGWSEGLQLMRVGGKSRLYIPSKLAYGDQGAGGIIPPNSVIIFEVEFLQIVPKTDVQAAPDVPGVDIMPDFQIIPGN